MSRDPSYSRVDVSRRVDAVAESGRSTFWGRNEKSRETLSDALSGGWWMKERKEGEEKAAGRWKGEKRGRAVL